MDLDLVMVHQDTITDKDFVMVHLDIITTGKDFVMGRQGDCVAMVEIVGHQGMLRHVTDHRETEIQEIVVHQETPHPEIVVRHRMNLLEIVVHQEMLHPETVVHQEMSHQEIVANLETEHCQREGTREVVQDHQGTKIEEIGIIIGINEGVGAVANEIVAEMAIVTEATIIIVLVIMAVGMDRVATTMVATTMVVVVEKGGVEDDKCVATCLKAMILYYYIEPAGNALQV
jgi:hypothetical protein